MSDGTMQALLAELVHLRRRVERLETIENLNMAQVAAEYVPTLADQAQATVLGRASGAGTGAPSALTAAQLVAVVATADGTGSGLDADTVDGYEASALAILASANTFAANQRVPRLEIDSASNYVDIDSAGALQMTSAAVTIANDGVVVLRNAVGVLIISDNTGGTVGIFTLRGGGGNAFEVFDGSTIYTPTKDNAGTFNVYWDATDTRYELQNKRGLTRSVVLTWLGG